MGSVLRALKALFLGALAAGLLYFGGTMAMDTYEMSRMEPVPASEVAEHSGVVTVEGWAAPLSSGETVETKYRGVEALAYEWEVQRYEPGNADEMGGWKTEGSGSDAVDFAVEDSSGSVKVEAGDGAELHTDVEGVEKLSEDRREAEGSVVEDDPVFVRGEATENGAVGGDLEIWEGGKGEAMTDSYVTSGILLFIGSILALGFLTRMAP